MEAGIVERATRMSSAFTALAALFLLSLSAAGVAYEFLVPPRKGSLRVLVADRMGPLPGARVLLRDGTNHRLLAEACADARGEAFFDPPSESALVIASASRDGAARIGQQVIQGAPDRLEAAGGTGFLCLALPPGRIEGRFEGAVPDRMEVALFQSFRNASISPSESPIARTVAVGGRFVFEDLVAGDYAIGPASNVDAHLDRRNLDTEPLLPAIERSESLYDGPSDVRCEVLAGGTTRIGSIYLTRGCRLRGVVTDDHGEPIRHATVFATSAESRPPRMSSSIGEFNFGYFRLSAASWPARRRLLARTTTTDESGRYEFVGLHPQRHRVEAFAPGYALAWQNVLIGLAATTSNFSLERGVEVRGIAAPNELLDLTMLGEKGPRESVLTDEDGRFEFAPVPLGTAVIEFDSDPLWGAQSERLEAARLLVGRDSVSDLDLRRVGVPVTLRLTTRGEPATNVRVVHRGIERTTDARGEANLLATNPDRFDSVVRVDVSGLPRFYSVSEEFDPPPSKPGGERVVSIETGSSSIDIVAFDRSGAPARAHLKQLVRFVSESTPAMEPVPSDARFDFDDFAVPLTTPCLLEALPSGDYFAVARFDSGALVAVHGPVREGTTRFEFREPDTRTVRFTLTDESGALRRGVRFAVQPSDEDTSIDNYFGAGTLIEGVTDADGVVTLRGIHVGLSRLVVNSNSPSDDVISGPVTIAEIVVESGERDLTQDVRVTAPGWVRSEFDGR